MTATELFDLAKNYGWKESICDLIKGLIILRAQNDCIVVLRRNSPKGNLLKKRSCDHEVSINYLRSGHMPYIIGPFGEKGFNLVNNRFSKWKS
jgi:hypothetical protein